MLSQQACGRSCRPFGAAGSSVSSSRVLYRLQLTAQPSRTRLQHVRAADAGALGGEVPEQRPQGMDYRTFPRIRERDPHRLLGVTKEAGFEEIQDARNFLYEQYCWHEPSREAIEMAFDGLLQKHLKSRNKFGFRPPRSGKRGEAIGEGRRPTLWQQFTQLFDPTVTLRTIINEGAVFGVFALWALFSSDQSFPMAAGFAYSVYQFQSKRTKRNPEGPFFGGNAIVGAILSTGIGLAVACGVMAVVTTPLSGILQQSARQVGGFITIAVLGIMGIYVK